MSNGIHVTIVKQTAKAVLLHDEENESEDAWFPLSEVVFLSKTGDSAVVDIPDWLLEAKGWE